MSSRLDLDDDLEDSVEGASSDGLGDSPPMSRGGGDDELDDSLDAEDANRYARSRRAGPKDDFAGSDDGSSEEDLDLRGGVKPASFDYSQLDVPEEMRQLFGFIDQYSPQEIELETDLKPFIPEYIPAVGDIDAFLKVPRPDDIKDELGLTILDEPGDEQTDPTVMEMQLRLGSKGMSRGGGPVKVHAIENAEQNSKKIQQFITKISELHKGVPPPVVNYSKNMPDVEDLMQEWPADIEKLLEVTKLPSAQLAVDTPEFARITCALLDIPVRDGKMIESLDVLFNLYAAFKDNQHFGGQKESAFTEEADVLALTQDAEDL